MKQQFYICKHCGNIAAMIHDAGVPMQCCGEKMHRLDPGTTEASGEKHIPVYTQEGDTIHVSVGSVEHPMVEAHYIQWVAIETTKGSQRGKLEYTDKPKAVFGLAEGETFVAAYEYCNLHGLWKN